MNSKVCFRCKEEKDISSFSKSKSNKSGYKSYCKVCHSEYTNIYRKNKRLKNPDAYFKHEKERKLIFKFKINLEEYESQIKAQGNRCKICNVIGEDTHKGMLCLDHDHTSGKIRGFLCDRCNMGLGHFKDDISLLEKAIEYLQKNS